ncbi:MAG: FAD-binding protein, partial [Alistipes sp.]|nr:FAD-binding protein [Alistipes sp.]
MKRIFNHVDLTDRNSFHVKQSAATLVEFSSADDLADYFSSERPSKLYVLGAGNNILFTRDYDGVLISPCGREVSVIGDDGERVVVRVDAGADWDSLVEWSVKHDLWGLENLSLIPSSVGAAPVQNIGAYGAEAGDTIIAVEYFDVRSLAAVRLSNEECRFGYRDSIFKRELRGRAVITAVEFALSRKPRPNLGYGDVAR